MCFRGKRDEGRGASLATWNKKASELTCPFRGSEDKLTPLLAAGYPVYTLPRTFSCLSIQKAVWEQTGSWGTVGRREDLQPEPSSEHVTESQRDERNQVSALKIRSQALNTKPGHSPFNTHDCLSTPQTSERGGVHQ